MHGVPGCVVSARDKCCWRVAGTSPSCSHRGHKICRCTPLSAAIRCDWRQTPCCAWQTPTESLQPRNTHVTLISCKEAKFRIFHVPYHLYHSPHVLDVHLFSPSYFSYINKPVLLCFMDFWYTYRIKILKIPLNSNPSCGTLAIILLYYPCSVLKSVHLPILVLRLHIFSSLRGQRVCNKIYAKRWHTKLIDLCTDMTLVQGLELLLSKPAVLPSKT